MSKTLKNDTTHKKHIQAVVETSKRDIKVAKHIVEMSALLSKQLAETYKSCGWHGLSGLVSKGKLY